MTDLFLFQLYMLDIVVFGSAAFAVHKLCPFVALPDMTGIGSLAALLVAAFMAMCVVTALMTRVVVPPMINLLVAGHHGMKSSLFDIGLAGNAAQAIGAGCSLFVLFRCWPLAVGVGTVGIFALDYFLR